MGILNTDAELVTRAAIGCTKAQDKLITNYQGLAFSIAAKLKKRLPHIDLADLQSDCLYGLTLAGRKCRNNFPFSQQVYFHIRSVQTTEGQKRMKYKNREGELVNHDDVISREPGALDLILKTEQRRRLLRAMRALSFKDRVLLYRRHFGALSTKEIAKKGGLHPETVRVRTKRAGIALKRQSLGVDYA